MINGKVGENHDLKPLLGCEQRTSPLVTHSLSFPCTMYKFNPSSSVNSSNRQYNRMKIGQLSTTFKHEFHMYVNVQRSAIYMVRWGSSLGNRTVPMHNFSHSSERFVIFYFIKVYPMIYTGYEYRKEMASCWSVSWDCTCPAAMVIAESHTRALSSFWIPNERARQSLKQTTASQIGT
jgi:hypothetical protein